jgi:AraC family transcriptional regulator
MGHSINLRSAQAFESAFRVEPEVAEESGRTEGVGIYRWHTPNIEGFELAESGELVIALHLGGSRKVREVTRRGLSRSRSAPGLLTILPPGRPAAFRTDGSVSLVSLHVPKSAAGIVSAGSLVRLAEASAASFAFRDTFASAAMEALLHAARTGKGIAPDYFAKVTEAVLCHLAHRAALTDQSWPDLPGTGDRLGGVLLAELLAYVDANIGANLSLDELAHRAGLSRSAFTRGFRGAVGLSPHQYLLVRRIERAKMLLCKTDFELSSIAQEVGFSSQSHFTANFRNLVGCTPARFRGRSRES